MPSTDPNGYCHFMAVNRLGTSASVGVDMASLRKAPTTTPKKPDAKAPGDTTSGRRPVIGAKATRLAGGTRVRITWKVTNGNPTRVKVGKIAGKTCKKTSRTSCVATGVRRGKIRVTVSMPGAKKITLHTAR